jgi:two-component system OmpR family sensor kinase
VLAGYGLLLAANWQLLQWRRLQAHQSQAQSAYDAFSFLEGAGASAQQLRLRLADYSSSELLHWLEPQPLPRAPGRQDQAPRVMPVGSAFVGLAQNRPLLQLLERQQLQGESDFAPRCVEQGAAEFCISSQTLWLAGKPWRLFTVQNISTQLAQERTLFLLLIAGAGGAALFTSALLRRVIARGLRPLEQLQHSMDLITSRTFTESRLSLDDQPPELQPIATAFNSLLDRLSSSWEHHKTFVNAVSHELRTPITLIGGYASRLQRRVANLSSDQVEQLALIREESLRMGRLVSDLLEIARNDSGTLKVAQEPLDAAVVLVEAYQRLSGAMRGRLRCHNSAQPISAIGDSERLIQCLSNLIENASKYAPPDARIELSVSCPADQVIFHVRDHGPGVPEEERQQIFERFVRGRDATAGPHAGSGIGLAVVQSLMQAMGGDVGVEDAPGGGADFQLRVPRLSSLEPLKASAALGADRQSGGRLSQLPAFIAARLDRAAHPAKPSSADTDRLQPPG